MHRAAGAGTFAIPENDLPAFKEQALSWASRFSVFVFLDSNGYEDRYGRYDLLLAAGRRSAFSKGMTALTLEELTRAHAAAPGWIFAAIPYEAGESLFGFETPGSDAEVWEPEIVLSVARGAGECVVWGAEAASIAAEIRSATAAESPDLPTVAFHSTTPRAAYLDNVSAIREQIAAGDFYEMNYCLSFTAGQVPLDAPTEVFRKLNAANPSPFAALYRNQTAWTICASPERYLCKKDGRIVSQPIKGTARRGLTAEEDAVLKEALENSEKDRAENIMIADLVRSDLAGSCVTGTIQVEELCAVYTYPTVHQMISTVSGVPDPARPFTDAIALSFPMGSMTGAPKKEVMKNIRILEGGPRGLYSGSIGYIDPDGDFDFNVVIRSLFWEEITGTLGYWAGGAITWDSVPEEEWEEIRLKAAAMERLFR